MRRAAKGLCFISKYKAFSDIKQHIYYVSLIGMRNSRGTSIHTFYFCQQFTCVEPLHLLFPVFRKKFLHARGF